jgi:hypothetical protein
MDNVTVHASCCLRDVTTQLHLCMHAFNGSLFGDGTCRHWHVPCVLVSESPRPRALDSINLPFLSIHLRSTFLQYKLDVWRVFLSVKNASETVALSSRDCVRKRGGESRVGFYVCNEPEETFITNGVRPPWLHSLPVVWWGTACRIAKSAATDVTSVLTRQQQSRSEGGIFFSHVVYQGWQIDIWGNVHCMVGLQFVCMGSLGYEF